MFLCENDILNKMKILKTCTLLCTYLFFITASFANETSDVVGNIGDDVLSSVKEEFPETYSALQNMEDSLGNEVIIEHAGDIYAQNKDIERALSYWRDAQQKKPEDQLLLRKIKQKKYLKK